MGKYQLEWMQMLQDHEDFKDWSIRASGGDLLIRVPEETDIDLLKVQFSDTISSVAPLVKAPPTTLKFYVGSSDEADFVFTLN